ncbi:uncharacterized protein LOC143562304 [Bidens hawaiensis]|uniref:uncharacterized protein LOC143562304 n=1 Tax=Bidens hawaiensis TaxID=980011 RepID=UPI00404A355C
MTVPFYMCCQYVDGKFCFVLHEWCAKLPLKVQHHVVHPAHTFFLLPKIPSKFFGVFNCNICKLPSNGFAYGCTMCGIYVDINCAFIPKEITHDAHPNHLLSKVKPLVKLTKRNCKACNYPMRFRWGYDCTSCDFYIHLDCALFLPRVTKHKCDEHTLSLRYEPAENHISEYFCEVCEDEFSPWKWFYHCTRCAQSMHTTCVPLILQCEKSRMTYDSGGVYNFLNVKFGGTLEIKGHSHHLTFVQGLESDGRCIKRRYVLELSMIFKCLEFALMDQIDHFDHHHPPSLVHLQQPSNKSEEDDDEDEEKDEDADNFVEEEHHGGKCNMCNEQIWSFHLSYYHCESCL